MPHEPFEIELSEEICTISHVDSLDDLRGPDGRYLAGTVNVTGIVNLYNMKLEQFPVRFGTVGGHFYCGKNRLTSLEGAPSSVSGYFGCHNNWLTSLEGAPSAVGGNFDCSWNKLTSLQGAPSAVGGNFDCSWNKLTSLQGAPSAVGGNFFCSDNRLTSLVGVHKILKRIGGGVLYIWSNPIESGGISLVLVEGLMKIVVYEDQPAFEIINRHLGQGMRGVLRCQEVLHEAGFGEYAQS